MTKNQHYIPRFYLKYFTDDMGHIHVYDKLRKKSFSSNPRNCGSENNFYDIPPELSASHDVNIFENGISKIENIFAEVLAEMINSLVINQEFDISFKAKFTPFIIFQLMRTKKFRKELGFCYEPFFKNYIPISKKENELIVISESFKQAEAMLNVNAQVELLQKIAKYIWIVGKNETDEVFLTSDAPILSYIHDKHKINNDLNFDDNSIEIIFPLTPCIILTMCDPSYFEKYLGNDCMCLPIDERSIENYNTLQYYNSDCFIYSNKPIRCEEYV